MFIEKLNLLLKDKSRAINHPSLTHSLRGVQPQRGHTQLPGYLSQALFLLLPSGLETINPINCISRLVAILQMSKHRDKSVIRLVQQIGFRSSLNNPVSIQQFYYHCYWNKSHFIKQKKLLCSSHGQHYEALEHKNSTYTCRGFL